MNDTIENTETTTETESSASEAAVLVVTSKIKKYIKAASGMNTAGDVAEALTAVVEAEIQKAISKAKESGRKTVMGRDVTAAN